MAARGEGPEQRAVGGGVAVAPGRGQAEAEDDDARAAGSRGAPRRARPARRSRRVHLRAAPGVGVLGQHAPPAPPRRCARARSAVSARDDARPRPRRRGRPAPPRPGLRNSSIPSQASVIEAGAGAGRLEHAGRRARSRSRPCCRGRCSAPRSGVQLKALWSRVRTWPRCADVGRHRLVVPSRCRRAGSAAPAGARPARRKNSSTRASRSGRRLPRKARSAGEARVGRRPGWCVSGSSAL